MYGRLVRRALAGIALALLTSAVVRAQDADEQTHDMSQMDMSHSAWTFMQDGVVNAMFNHQGGPRGGRRVRRRRTGGWAWRSRTAGSGQLTFTGMFSLDPATVGTRGYREIFQAGEALDGRPIIDRQHPHDSFMQLSAGWRMPVGEHDRPDARGGACRRAGARPRGVHASRVGRGDCRSRRSAITRSTPRTSRLASSRPESTHGRWAAEGSVFNGREPDEHRWDFDFGRLDSVSGRLWFRPADEWAVQVSAGRLVQPEQLEAGNVHPHDSLRIVDAGAGRSMSAMTVAYGRNDHAGKQAAFGELTRQRGAYTLSSRLEFVQVENELLIDDLTPASTGEHAGHLDLLGALTVGADSTRRTLARRGGWIRCERECLRGAQRAPRNLRTRIRSLFSCSFRSGRVSGRWGRCGTCGWGSEIGIRDRVGRRVRGQRAEGRGEAEGGAHHKRPRRRITKTRKSTSVNAAATRTHRSLRVLRPNSIWRLYRFEGFDWFETLERFEPPNQRCSNE